ncbi:hypothetical protein AAY473_025745 [Plecturocebus cupreus]
MLTQTGRAICFTQSSNSNANLFQKHSYRHNQKKMFSKISGRLENTVLSSSEADISLADGRVKQNAPGKQALQGTVISETGVCSHTFK